MRLGFPVRAFGVPYSRTRGPQPHWSLRLLHLRDVARYLQAKDIHMYRLDGALVDAVAELEAGRHDAALSDWERELADLGAHLNRAQVRVSFHPHSAVVLNSPDEAQVLQSVGRLVAMARTLDALGAPPEAVIIVHVGGVYGDPVAASERFVRTYDRLPEGVQHRLALENDDRRFDHLAVLGIHGRCGIPLVFDNLHHAVLGCARDEREALAASLATWPEEVRPKVHFATPRSEARGLGNPARLKVPTWTEHSDFINPFELAAFARRAEGLRPFDVMLEARARDLALLKLREDLARFAPDVAAVCE